MNLILQAISALLKRIEKRLDNTITAPAVASVGQTVIVKAVDKNGRPIEWEAVNLPEMPEIPDNYLRYEVVDEIPAEQEDGVLYIVQTA